MKSVNYIKAIVILLFIILLVLIARDATSQSIMISNDGRVMIECSEEEKAIKISSGLIKAKEDVRFETHLNKIKVMWEVKYIKDSKLYLLYKNHQKYYESTTISGIRSKYSSSQ